MSKIQELEWGSVHWIFEPEDESIDNLRVGISMMKPHAVQHRHIHCGDEQFIYVISGRGWQKIGKEESIIEPGAYFHISAGTAHESENTGDCEIVKLLVSLPAVLTPPMVAMDKRKKTQQMESIDNKEFLKETIKELIRHDLKSLKVPLSIFDEENKLVYSNNEYPEYCRSCCSVHKKIDNCELYTPKMRFVPPFYGGVSAFICLKGLVLYILPIVCDGTLLGYIKTGHIRTIEECNAPEDEPLPYQVPKSTETGMLNMIDNLAKSICRHYKVCCMQVKQTVNSRTLQTTKNKALNLQINQHFLFNTLNTIASMAIKENAIQTYQAVGDLAQMFRYTLQEETSFISLGEELNYIKNFTNLQKLRYGKNLVVVYEVPDELMNFQKVPFNFLQPIVENCFKHAFSEKAVKMKILIKADRMETMVRVQVVDNGKGIPPDIMKDLNKKIKSGNEMHGTSMVVRKLQSMYGESFQYQINSVERSGTNVSIAIPLSVKSEKELI